MDYGETWVRLRVGVSSGRGGNGIRRDLPHWSIHQEEADGHSGEGGLLYGICNVHGGGEDAGDNTDDALSRLRRSKQAGGVNEEEV